MDALVMERVIVMEPAAVITIGLAKAIVVARRQRFPVSEEASIV